MQNCCARKLAGCGNIALRKVVVVGGNNNATASGARAASLADLQKLSRSLNQRLLLRLEHLQWCSVCDSAKIFLTSKCSYIYFFLTPPIKTKTGIANRWETTNSKTTWTNHYDWPNHAAGAVFITFFSVQVLIFAVPLTSLSKLWKISGHKTILLRQTGIFSLFFIEFSFAGSHTEHRWSCS